MVIEKDDVKNSRRNKNGAKESNGDSARLVGRLFPVPGNSDSRQ